MSTVPLGQIGYVFDKLTSRKLMSQEDKKWIAFKCEVAHRSRLFEDVLPGVELYNNMCGFKTMPFD